MNPVVMSERDNKSVKAAPTKKRKSRKKRHVSNPNGHNQWVNDRPPLENLQITLQKLPDLQPYLDGLENDWENCPPNIVRVVDQLIGEVAFWMKQAGQNDREYQRHIPDRIWRPVFLRTLRNTLSVRAACEKCGIDRSTAERHKRNDPAFAAEWERAYQDAVDMLEGAAVSRAVRGVLRQRPIVSNGKIIGHEPIVRYSDRLHGQLLIAHHPKHRRRLEVSSGEQRERAENVIRDYMTEQDCDRADAIAQLSQTIPEIVQLLEA